VRRGGARAEGLGGSRREEEVLEVLWRRTSRLYGLSAKGSGGEMDEARTGGGRLESAWVQGRGWVRALGCVGGNLCLERIRAVSEVLM
jgi:hypothetical protein